MSSDRGLSQEYSAMSVDNVNQYQQGLDDLKSQIANSKTAFGNNTLNFQNTLSNLGTDSTQKTEKDSVVPGAKFAELAKGGKDFLASRAGIEGEEGEEGVAKATTGVVDTAKGVVETAKETLSTGGGAVKVGDVGAKVGGTIAEIGEAGEDVARTWGESAKAFGKLGAVAGLGDIVGAGFDIDDLINKNVSTGDKVKDSLGIAGAGLDMVGLGLDATIAGSVVGIPLQILGTASQVVSSIWGWVEDDSKAKKAKQTAQTTETNLQNANLAKRKTEIQSYNLQKSQPMVAEKSIAQSGGASVGRLSQF